jgi:hypothetical protein
MPEKSRTRICNAFRRKKVYQTKAFGENLFTCYCFFFIKVIGLNSNLKRKKIYNEHNVKPSKCIGGIVGDSRVCSQGDSRVCSQY